MILVDRQIRELCNNGLVTPFDPELINPSSLDVRLGNNLIIDVEGDSQIIDISNHRMAEPYWLEPNGFVLAETLEYLRLPWDVAIELKLKSSRAREGLSHALAGWVDNGFHGVLTLELKNYSNKKPVAIYPGLRIGQLIIHRTELPDRPYQGKYSGFTTVVGSLDK